MEFFDLGNNGERCFEMYTCDIEEPGFREYHERLQTFLLWYVDAASFIDVDDDRWRYYLVWVFLLLFVLIKLIKLILKNVFTGFRSYLFKFQIHYIITGL